jgi:hypothetical protein
MTDRPDVLSQIEWTVDDLDVPFGGPIIRARLELDLVYQYQHAFHQYEVNMLIEHPSGWLFLEHIIRDMQRELLDHAMGWR